MNHTDTNIMYERDRNGITQWRMEGTAIWIEKNMARAMYRDQRYVVQRVQRLEVCCAV